VNRMSKFRAQTVARWQFARIWQSFLLHQTLPMDCSIPVMQEKAEGIGIIAAFVGNALNFSERTLDNFKGRSGSGGAAHKVDGDLDRIGSYTSSLWRSGKSRVSVLLYFAPRTCPARELFPGVTDFAQTSGWLTFFY
jgi:hypothetical protein